MTYSIQSSPTVPAPGESSSGWPVDAAGQAVLAAQRARNQVMRAGEIAKANTALAALAVRSAWLAGLARPNTEAQAQVALEMVYQQAIITACTNGTYTNIVKTVYTLEDGKPFIGGGTF